MFCHKLSLTLLLLAANCLINVNCVQKRNLSVGLRQPGDVLLAQKDVEFPLKLSEVIEETIKFVTTGIYDEITKVEVVDRMKDGTGADVSIVQGGPGRHYVLLKFKSQMNHGIHSTIFAYARQKSNIFSVGNRVPFDREVYRQSIHYSKMMRRREETLIFNLMNKNDVISLIQVNTTKKDGILADVSLIEGGPGYNNATLKFISERHREISSVVVIYGYVENYNFSLGKRQDGDREIMRHDIVYPSIPSQVRVEKLIFGFKNQFNIFTKVEVIDPKKDGTGTEISLLGGGPGFNNVSLKFQSQVGYGIQSTVVFHGLIQNRNFSIGQRVSGDKEVLRHNVNRSLKPQNFREETIQFNILKESKITMVQVVDTRTDGTGADVALVEGGLGHNNVTLKFTSQKNHGIHSIVYLYAHTS